jgi:hypothetical protein
MVVYICNPSYLGFKGRRIVVHGPGKNKKVYLKNKLRQKGLEVWLKL